MYSRQEASSIRKKFWISFGQYLSPVPSASGKKINWINYKSGVRFINFKMDVSNGAYIGIEISHPGIVERELYYNNFILLKPHLEKVLGEKWLWQAPDSLGSDGAKASIFIELKNVNIYHTADWPAIISYLKPRIIKLDNFWHEYKAVFEMIKE